MIVPFVGLTFLVYYWSYPVVHFFIPLCIWVAFRFKMLGATAAVFLNSAAAIFFTSMGMGIFFENVEHPLLILVSFLAVIAAATLIVAAVINEQENTWREIREHNVNLKGDIETQINELGELSSEIYIKEKLASMGLLMFRIAKRVQGPVENIQRFSDESLGQLNQFQVFLDENKDSMKEKSTKIITEHLQELKGAIEDIAENQSEVDKIVDLIEQQSVRISPKQMVVTSVNLHTILNHCLTQVLEENAKKHPGFTVNVIKNFDRMITMVPALPEDLIYAILQLLEGAIYSMTTQKDQEGWSYNPVLEMNTADHNDMVEIVIRDNGVGVDEDAMGIGFTIAQDIIVNVHHGTLKVESKDGEYFRVSIMLPKESMSS